jgi:hypothetical protein
MLDQPLLLKIDLNKGTRKEEECLETRKEDWIDIIMRTQDIMSMITWETMTIIINCQIISSLASRRIQ